MRKIILQMMTTLNGRLDDPIDWLPGVGDDQYREIDRIYAGYDTVLVGRTTYEEMAAYWPGALSEEVGTETNRVMARRMNDYRKIVFSRSGTQALTPWNNVEPVVAATDADLIAYLGDLKAQPGGDIHLSGGASFAQSVVALDLVDEFYFFTYPIVSPGQSWFSTLTDKRDLQLVRVQAFENGVVGSHHVSHHVAERVRAATFTEMLR